MSTYNTNIRKKISCYTEKEAYFTPLNYNMDIVKPVYNTQTWDPEIVATVDRWSLFRGLIRNIISYWDLKMVVVVGMCSLFVGGLILRFFVKSNANSKFTNWKSCCRCLVFLICHLGCIGDRHYFNKVFPRPTSH